MTYDFSFLYYLFQNVFQFYSTESQIKVKPKLWVRIKMKYQAIKFYLKHLDTTPLALLFICTLLAASIPFWLWELAKTMMKIINKQP